MNSTDYTPRFIDANGISTHYIEAGSGEPLILIHGGGAGASGRGNWARCIPLFRNHFRTIAVDMVGFGETGKPDPGTFTYSQETRCEHIAAFIRALNLEKAHLVGNSMGGATAMGIAVTYPDLVDKLVLMGSAGLNTEITPSLLPVVNYDFTQEGMVRLIKALANPDFHITDEIVKSRWEKSVQPEARKAYAAIMEWVKGQGGLYYPNDFIQKIKHTTLVVNGKLDEVVPLTAAYKFLELIENSWGYIIPNCGHWAMIEYPEEFSKVVINFINTH